ncbi:hypothetical protein [Undibacterium sp. TJN19]|uniref:hypothetical protein n=1 Tax=Undibacterium sp. TJN19 TaxID=3413055 RepID=UPI003BF22042
MKKNHLRSLCQLPAMMLLALASSTFAAADNEAILKDKPYSLDLTEIAALDPKPLKISEFSPDPDKKIQGVRITSTGRIFPIEYEVITFPAPADTDRMLIAISNSLEKHDDIILKQMQDSKTRGHSIHYFQQVSENGKPHHVSSNYIFVKNNVTYHIVGTSYAAKVMSRESWGEPSPDKNADEEAKLLYKALQFK